MVIGIPGINIIVMQMTPIGLNNWAIPGSGHMEVVNLKTRIKVVIGMALVVGIVIVTAPLLMKSPVSQPAPFPMDTAEKLNVEQLADKGFPGNIMLPTWMPGQIKLREIYFAGVAILVYSDEDVRDYRDDDITIEIKKSNFSPTPEKLKEHTSGEVLKVNDFWIVLLENARPGPNHRERGIEPILTYFWHDGFYYIITANKAQTTREDMMRIMENMNPIGPETLRKATDSAAA